MAFGDIVGNRNRGFSHLLFQTIFLIRWQLADQLINFFPKLPGQPIEFKIIQRVAPLFHFYSPLHHSTTHHSTHHHSPLHHSPLHHSPLHHSPPHHSGFILLQLQQHIEIADLDALLDHSE